MMNGLVMMLLAVVVLGGAYLIYGRYLAKKWGVDPDAKTPAYEMEDGVDYVPADTNVVFGHQFASIAGAGPINGPIQAAMFGWLPVMLWILLGGVFFGAVQDFAAMYASVKNKGRSIGYIIEVYIGKLGKRLFLLFTWLFSILVVAAFADIVAGTFNAPERMAHFRIPVCDCCLRDSCMGSASAQGLSEQLPAAGHDYRCGSGNMCL